MDISYTKKMISKTYNTICIYVDRSPSWKIHIERITCKLSAACYSVRLFKPIMSQEITEDCLLSLFHFHYEL
jgi:hypothetical protein